MLVLLTQPFNPSFGFAGDQDEERIRVLVKSHNTHNISEFLSTANEIDKLLAFSYAINETLLSHNIVSNAKVIHLFKGKIPVENIRGKVTERISTYNQFIKREETKLETHHKEKEWLNEHRYDDIFDISSGDWADRAGAYTMKANHFISGGRQGEEERIDREISNSQHFIRQIREAIGLLNNAIE